MKALGAVRSFLLRWCELKLTLKAPPSPSGRHLELAQLGMTGTPDEWARSDSAARRMADFAHYEFVMGQLDALSRLVLVASVLPVGFVTVEQWEWLADLRPVYVPLYDLERGRCYAPTSTGHACLLPRLFGEPRCHLHRQVEARPVTFVAHDGAEAIASGQAIDPRALREPASLEDDPRRVRVCRAAPIYAQPTEIAELLGVTVWAVREAGRRGRAQLVEALLEEHAHAS